MTTRSDALLLVLLLLAPLAAAAQTPRLVVELEGGPAWQSSSDVEIPNDGTATRFSLRDVVGSGPWPAGRADPAARLDGDARRVIGDPRLSGHAGALLGLRHAR